MHDINSRRPRLEVTRHGASLAETGIIVGLIAILAISAVSHTGKTVVDLFTGSDIALSNAIDGAGTEDTGNRAGNGEGGNGEDSSGGNGDLPRAPTGLADFASIGGVEINMPVESALQAVTGLDAPAPVSIAGGSNAEFQVLDADLSVVRDWSSAPATIPAGGSVRVRQMIAAYETAATTTLTVGEATADWTLTTRVAVTMPSSLANFTAVTGADPSSDVDSNSQDVYGIEIPVAATLSMSGTGSAVFRVDNGAGWSAYDAADKMADIGARVQVRITTPAVFQSTRVATLKVGGANADFAVTTRAASTAPTNFVDFATSTGANPGAVVLSNTQTLAGLEAPATVSISGGNVAQFRVLDAAGAVVRDFGTAATAVPVGGRVQVRQTASATWGATATATLTVGNVARTYSLVTRAAVTKPTGLVNFGTVRRPPNMAAWSNEQTVTGIEALATVSISGGNNAKFRIVGADGSPVYDWRTASAGVSAGQRVQMFQTALPTPGAKAIATLNVGGVSVTYTIITDQP